LLGCEVVHFLLDESGDDSLTHLIFSDERYDLYYTYGAYDRISALTLKDANGQVLTQFGYDYTKPNTSVSALVNGSLVNFATATIGTGSLVTEKQLANGLDLKYTYDTRKRILSRTATINSGALQTHNYTYDSSGNISRIDNQTFGYDYNSVTGKTINRITQVTGGLKTLGYDNGLPLPSNQRRYCILLHL
jgi:hypothetical protein